MVVTGPSRLAELLSSLSLATDLAVGVPLETSLRTALVATHVGRARGLHGQELRDVYYASLLRHLGCTAWSHEAARIGGDDHDVLHTFEGVDRANKRAMLGRIVKIASDAPLGRRARTIARVLVTPSAGDQLATAQCAQAQALARDLELGPGVVAALGQLYERHDGRGAPRALRGDAITPVARLVVLAQLIEVLHRRLGRDGALAELARRRDREIAADVVDTAHAEALRLWDLLERPITEGFLAAEPTPHLVIRPERVDSVALAFGRFADLKSPHTLGHSPAVAELATAAGRAAGCSAPELATLRGAALLHDLGAVSVANTVWDHAGTLGIAAWEQVRLHTYFAERILARSPALAPLAAIAGAHHERLDGSGYHRSIRGETLAPAARVLAVADVYVALTEDRPHRPARAREAAARHLTDEARAGRLCREAVAAVLASAGHPRAARPALPVGLTEREAEVLGHVARGLSSKEIAAALAIAPRTVKHHIEHIYEKTGVSTRAAAALFAARHDLV
jgi:HD-GYP domain-containing protein (c-di-GMP phosphodiesterase class II)/DNA-binding CsgD family transcriptional regulator